VINFLLLLVLCTVGIPSHSPAVFDKLFDIGVNVRHFLSVILLLNDASFYIVRYVRPLMLQQKCVFNIAV